MNMLAALARETKTLVLLIDHYGKIIETGVRGSSAKSAANDAILACLGDRDPTTGVMSNRKMAVTKLRIRASRPRRSLRSREDGRRLDLRRPLAPGRAGAAAPKGKPWPKALVIFKRALDEALDTAGKTTIPRAGMPEVKAVDREAVRAEFFRLYPGETQQSEEASPSFAAPRTPSRRGIMCSINVGPDLGQTIFWIAMMAIF